MYKGGAPGPCILSKGFKRTCASPAGWVRVVSHSETADGTSSLEGQAEGSGTWCTTPAIDNKEGVRVSLYGDEFLSSALVLYLKVSKKGVILYPFFSLARARVAFFFASTLQGHASSSLSR